MKLLYFLSMAGLGLFSSCSPYRQLGKSAKQDILDNEALRTAHVGISIYDPASGRYLYNYQGDKYFVPASNTKLPTCYAAMKYLGDSLPGLEVTEYSNHVFIRGTADPSFLHPDFKINPVYNYLRSLGQSNKPVWFSSAGWQESGLGSGWSWNDYEADYMAERSAFPIYGNLAVFSGRFDSIKAMPGYFLRDIRSIRSVPGGYVSNISRELNKNEFTTIANGRSPLEIPITFHTSDSLSFILLMDTLHLQNRIYPPNSLPPQPLNNEVPHRFRIHSQPTDTVLNLMMHRSDNFFAEQSLLMVSNELLHLMNDGKIIDTLLKTDFRDLPQKPTWVDGCGLSRYNLFSPQDLVTILNKIRTDFGMDRTKNILATGNTGTLHNYYKAEEGFIYAKTGTLSGVVALSGFLYTKKNRLLIFSVLVNNQRGPAAIVRRAVEKFIESVRNSY